MTWTEFEKTETKKKCHNWKGKPLLWPITVGPNKTKDDVLLGLHVWTKEQFTVASTVITAMASYFTDVKKVEVFKLSFFNQIWELPKYML